MEKINRISSGHRGIDKLMGGGIECGIITQFYGEGGSGKTNMCILLSNMAVKQGKKVIYIDSEGLSADRLFQVFEGNLELLESLLVKRVYSLEEQSRAIDNIYNMFSGDEKVNIGMIILDSISMFMRSVPVEDRDDGQQTMKQQTLKLMTLARLHTIPVIITNQVYSKRDGDSSAIEPLGGHVLNHNSKTIIKLSKIPGTQREAKLIKHRSIKEGIYTKFLITDRGLGEV